MTENQKENLLKKLIESHLSSYFIAKKTGISAQTIINYRSKKTKPTAANIQILEQFFSEMNANFSNNSNSVVIGNNNSGNIGNNYYSDSPDVLRAQIEVLDERIREKDAQIKEKDAQIKELHALLNEMIKKH